MESAYNLVYSHPAADLLLTLRKNRLAPLLYDLRRLAESPNLRSDYVVKDFEGREIDHLLIGDFVISYWLDHSVSELRIVNITDVS